MANNITETIKMMTSLRRLSVIDTGMMSLNLESNSGALLEVLKVKYVHNERPASKKLP